MSARKLNALEQKLHQAALADTKKTLSQKECEALIPDGAARLAAINFLLASGLLKAMTDTKGTISFRAVAKKELDVKKDMSGEESMILSYIQAAKNEGIWTKHLRAKTELHQTVVDRCLKSLTQKKLIKTVPSVKYPTRKIYMLFHLEPSVEMTGGPWYTENELDTEFIKLLCSACLRFIRDRSTPKRKTSDADAQSQLLFPISNAPKYPTAHDILSFLSKSRITETQLNVEHVDMLLNVLILDGEIERVPAFGAAMWEQSGEATDDVDEDGKKRKRKDRSDDGGRSRKRSKRAASSDSSESESERESRSSKKKRKKARVEESSDEDGAAEAKKKKRKKRSQESDSDDGSGEDKKSKRKKKSKKRRRDDSSESESSDSSSDSDSDSRARSKTKGKRKRKMSSSPAPVDVSEQLVEQEYGANVYRAVRQERVALGLGQAPCVSCPTFDFCKDKGPVNPQECAYYERWLAPEAVAKD